MKIGQNLTKLTTCKINFLGLEEIEKTQNVENLYQNFILQTFPKNVMKNTWCPEAFLFNKKIGFISKIKNLDFVDDTTNSTCL